jgi:hypothetical protein
MHNNKGGGAWQRHSPQKKSKTHQYKREKRRDTGCSPAVLAWLTAVTVRLSSPHKIGWDRRSAYLNTGAKGVKQTVPTQRKPDAIQLYVAQHFPTTQFSLASTQRLKNSNITLELIN